MEGFHVNRVRGRQRSLLTDPDYRKEHADPLLGNHTAGGGGQERGSAGLFGGTRRVGLSPVRDPGPAGHLFQSPSQTPLPAGRQVAAELPQEMYEELAGEDTLAILISGEAERRAGYVAPVEGKLDPCRILSENHIDVPMALVTRSEEVVKDFLRAGS